MPAPAAVTEHAGRCGPQSKPRSEIVEELENIGVNIDVLKVLSTNDLQSLLTGLTSVLERTPPYSKPRYDQKRLTLSDVDRSILKYLLSSQGSVASIVLVKELEVPLSTVQRRRNRLEENLIEISYLPRLAKLGWREATLSISGSANTYALGKEILEISDAVVSVSRTIGDTETNLAAHVIFRTNLDLMALIDRIKEKEGVKKVFWRESIEVIGKSNSGYAKAIDSFV